MYERHIIGNYGEEYARIYLINKGYKIIQTNFRCNFGEIDIIAIDENLKEKELVFFEIKTRSNKMYGMPKEAVDKTKQRHIKKVATYFLYKNHIENFYIRFDVIEVYILNKIYKINHIKQAFE